MQDNKKTEKWMPITNYKGIYEVSSLGRIRSIDRNVCYNNGHVRFYRGIYLSPKIEKHGYLAVNLKNGDKGILHRIHRLVAEAFIPNTDGKDMVNHIDGNKANNCIENLEWNSCTENNRHARKTGLVVTPSGADYSGSKAVIQLDLDGNYIKEFGGLREAERATKATAINISYCCRGKYQQSGGFKWMYKKDFETINQ